MSGRPWYDTIPESALKRWRGAVSTLSKLEQSKTRKGRKAAKQRAMALTLGLLRRGGEADMLRVLGLTVHDAVEVGRPEAVAP